MLYFIVAAAALILIVVTINTVSAGRTADTHHYRPEPASHEELVRLAGAIRIKTVSHHDQSKNDVSEFSKFQQFLVNTYPLFHRTAERHLLNEYSIIYRWQGANEALPPVLLTAHYDVVPADSTKWSVLPFAGVVKDGFLWGRGTIDTKNTLISCMEAAEQLCSDGFTPERTVYFAFGGDEEISGAFGAKKMAAWFIEHNIHFDWMWDEGAITGDGLLPGMLKKLSLIGTAEKGQVNIKLETRSAGGGHAAMPPRFTATGRIARAVARIEASPFPLRWIKTTRVFFKRMAAAGVLPYRIALSNLWLTGGLIKMMMGRSPNSAALLRTTTAPTVISGSSKENVLADSASAVINIRILPGDTIDGVVRRVSQTISDKNVNVGVLQNSGAEEASEESSITSEGYRFLEKMLNETIPDSVVLPYLATTASDSRNYSECCTDTYRYAPMILNQEELDRIHGVDERISFENFGLGIRCYKTLIKML